MGELLKKVQQTELEILLEIDRICKEENIKYYLFYGTLIGAVRHGGFIPWDDDIDIVLFRDEYDRLLNILPQKLGEKFWLQCYETDNNYWNYFAKVRKKGTLYKEKNLKNIPDEKCGIWVDIFPLDNLHDKPLFNKRVNYLIKTIGFTLKKRELSLPDSEFSRRYLPIMKYWSLFSKETLLKKENKLFRKYKNRESEYCSDMGDFTSAPVPYKKTSFGQEFISFEGEMLPVPQDYDNILTTYYGDYMTLPPENERFVHTPTDVIV